MPFVNVSVFSPITRQNILEVNEVSTFGKEMILTFTATESTTSFYLTKGWSAAAITAQQEVTLDYLYIQEQASQQMEINCGVLAEVTNYLLFNGINMSDSVIAKTYLNHYFKRNLSYAAYQSVNQLCQTNQGSFVLMQPGVEYEEVRGYRFGFNGKEKDHETFGIGDAIAFEARIFDSRLGRFLSVDPWSYKYSWQTPYAYHRNTPISSIDWNGLGDIDSRQANRKVRKYERKWKKYAKEHDVDESDAKARNDFDQKNANKRWMYISGKRENNFKKNYDKHKSNSGVSFSTRWYSTSAVYDFKRGATTTVTIPAVFGDEIPITNVGNNGQSSGVTSTTSSTPFVFGPFAAPRTGIFFITNLGPLTGSVGVSQNDVQNNVNAPGTISVIAFQPIEVGVTINSTTPVNTANGGVIHLTTNGSNTGLRLGFRPIIVPANTITVPVPPPAPIFVPGPKNFRELRNFLKR
jgi:RHS repeat-associated protein